MRSSESSSGSGGDQTDPDQSSQSLEIQPVFGREYIHGPPSSGYIDEVVTEILAGDEPLFPIQDWSWTVQSLVAADGTVHTQYAWSPFGRLLAKDNLKSTVFDDGDVDSRLGFQGLFHDRIGAEPLEPDLLPGYETLVHVRNRVFRPETGRWLQSDPHGLGSTALGLLQGASEPATGFLPISPDSVYIDGSNRHAFVSHNPLVNDPTGQYGIIGVTITAFDMAEMSKGMMDMARFGVGQQMKVYGLTTNYSQSQLNNVAWATDWSQSDHNYNRSGVKPQAMTTRGADLARQRTQQTHHIATNKHSIYSGTLRSRFAEAGMTLDDPKNKMDIAHGGRHSADYHRWVLRTIESAYENTGYSKIERKAALEGALDKLRARIKADPSILYDTVGGKETGWRGMRSRIRW